MVVLCYSRFRGTLTFENMHQSAFPPLELVNGHLFHESHLLERNLVIAVLVVPGSLAQLLQFVLVGGPAAA